MSFLNLYNDICSERRILDTVRVCDLSEVTAKPSQWWTKEEPYEVKENTYHVPTIYNIGKNTFPAKDLTPENREEILALYESYAYSIMFEELEIPLNKIISTKAIDIYAEPVPCYPLKVLVEVLIDVS
jgi:hypothetical protein|tara:strand:- start:107 stop:490 length:384 start_codon:yes stop_codon:yes gene_type:complete